MHPSGVSSIQVSLEARVQRNAVQEGRLRKERGRTMMFQGWMGKRSLRENRMGDPRGKRTLRRGNDDEAEEAKHV